jgi:hypothetical protein
VLALRQLQRAGRYDFVGVDRNPVIVEAVRNGEMLATLVQDSEKMAALAVEMADAAIKAPASTGRNILPPFVMDRRCCAMPAEPKNQRMKTANVRLCQYYFEQERMSIRLSLAVALAIYLAHWNSHPGWLAFAGCC